MMKNEILCKEKRALDEFVEAFGLNISDFKYSVDDGMLTSPIYDLCEKLGIEIERKSMSKENSGRLEDNVITLNLKHSARRRIFTLAHELGHYLYNHLHNRQNDDDRKEIYNNDPAIIARERFANDFAARILMPENFFIEKFNEFKGDLMEIADFFRTSSEACKYRAINLGIFRINDKTFVKGYYG